MKKGSLVERFYPETSLLGHTFVDGSVAYYSAINNLIGSNSGDIILLDLGCGRGTFMDNIDDLKFDYLLTLQNFRGRVKKVIGIDIDSSARTNTSVDEFRLIELNKPWPVDSESVDICISDWVIEHVEDISFFFKELKRVMKKNGFACFRTINKYSYIALFSILIPNSLHKTILRRVQDSRKKEDVFPTTYNCNTRNQFIESFKKNGFKPYVFYHISEPTYFTFSYISFAFGYYLHKVLPSFLKTTILAFGKKI